ncbi:MULTISPECIES: S8 family peptidase [Halobacillus]|uniref:S8 family peptidase n=1 Tax=Halobacillus TaxID=45667 RepID=UPI0009A63712|nr:MULTISPECIES: S8 family peptidase [Halobacillus]
MSTKILEIRERIEQGKNIPKGLKLLNVESLWEKSDQGKGNVIAVIDSGCDRNHPDLKDNIIGGYNFTGEGEHHDFSDSNFHGTHIAGTIAANNIKSGIIGVSPQSKLLILKVIDKRNSGTYTSLVNAINYAIKWKGPKGEKVSAMNISLSGHYDDDNLYKSIVNATKRNIPIIAASGNSGDSKRLYPASFKEVLQVGSVNESLKLNSFSNKNGRSLFLAPGSNILSTFPNSLYGKITGTSMAAPHITGAVSLIIDIMKKEKVPVKLETVLRQLTKYSIPLSEHMDGEDIRLVQFN